MKLDGNETFSSGIPYSQSSADNRRFVEIPADDLELLAYRDALNNTAIVGVTDKAGRIVEVNDLFCHISGYRRGELIGADHRLLNSGHHPDQFFPHMWREISAGRIWRDDICNRAKCGRLYWVDSTIAPRRDKRGRIIGYISIRFDISARKAAEAEVMAQLDRLKTAENLLSDIVETLPCGLVAYDARGRLLFQNGAYGSLCLDNAGVAMPAPERTSQRSVDLEPTNSGRTAPRSSTGKTKTPSRPYIQQVDPERWVQIHDRRSPSGNLVSVRTDISDLKRAQLLVKQQAEQDALTGIGNRNLLMRRLAALTRLRPTAADGSTMLMVIDLDDFKLVNDRFGHDGGDTLLRQVAQRLQSSVRRNDTVARLGGDEFAVLMRNVERRNAERIAEKLLVNIRDPLKIGHHRLTPAASIGVALFPTDAKTPAELIRNADLALYQAKLNGRCRYSLYDSSVAHRHRRRSRLLDRLKDALLTRTIDVAFQPKCDLLSGRHTGFEALVRWSVGNRQIPPPEMISIAEEAGLINELSDIIMERALDAMAAFRAENLAPGTIAFNIVAAQLQRPDFIERLANQVGARGMTLNDVEIEVTENVILDRTAGDFARVLSHLRNAGAAIALDDFGTGYASLTHLKQFPIDYLKIDRSFISGILNETDDEVIVRTIISLAHNLGLRVIAEGVETSAQCRQLSNFGCDIIQGFLLAQPMNKQDAAQYLKHIQQSGICQKPWADDPTDHALH